MDYQQNFSLVFSDEQIELIEAYAYDLLNWKDIAHLLSVPVAAFKTVFDNQNSAVFLAYQAGRVKRKLALRKPILKLAEMGSPQAELLAIKFLDEQLISETDD